MLASCCLTNGIIFGIINTFGILYDKLHTKMESEGVVDASAKCGKFNFLFKNKRVASRRLRYANKHKMRSCDTDYYENVDHLSYAPTRKTLFTVEGKFL